MTLLELILFVLPAFTGASDEEDEEEPSDEERPRQRARREEEDEEEDWPGYRSNAEDIYNEDGWSPSSPSSSEDEEEEDGVGGTGDQGAASDTTRSGGEDDDHDVPEPPSFECIVAKASQRRRGDGRSFTVREICRVIMEAEKRDAAGGTQSKSLICRKLNGVVQRSQLRRWLKHKKKYFEAFKVT